MSDAVHETLQRHERKLAEVDGLRNDLSVVKERQNQQIAATDRTNESVNKLAKAFERKCDRYDKTLYEGTDKDAPHDVRIQSLEGFATRVKSWAKWTLGIIGTLVTTAAIAIAGWFVSKGNHQ